jgi:hypothetical protein
VRKIRLSYDVCGFSFPTLKQQIGEGKSMPAMAGNSYSRGRISTVDLLLLISLDQLIFRLIKRFTFNINQAILRRRSMLLSLALQLVFPGQGEIYTWISYMSHFDALKPHSRGR